MKTQKKNKITFKDVESIPIDKDTQIVMKELVTAMNEIQTRLGIVVQIYLNAKSKKGDYAISKDFTMLKKIKKEK